MQMLIEMLPKVQAGSKRCLQNSAPLFGKGADGGRGLKISGA